jgi:hypothetical protein
MIIKKILGYSIIFIHCISIPIALFIIFFIKNFYLNFFLLIYFTFIVVQWVTYGNCILSPLENYLLGKNDKTEESMITNMFSKYINKHLMNIFLTYLPLFMIIIILFKLYYNKY